MQRKFLVVVKSEDESYTREAIHDFVSAKLNEARGIHTSVIYIPGDNLTAALVDAVLKQRQAEETLTACQAENTRLVLENRKYRDEEALCVCRH